MGLWSAGRRLYRAGRDWVQRFLANEDALAASANSGAFLVWSNQPFYPLYVWALVGWQAWPALLTWLSTPFFVGVAILGRTHPLASRVLFVVAGLLNTLVSVKAFGADTAVGWFLVPCLVIAATFFRAQEWKVAAALLATTAASALLVRHLGAPLHAYDAADARSLAHLNLWSASVLSAYLLYAAVRARREPREGTA